MAAPQTSTSASKPLTIGIVGFGSFGQFIAERLVKAGHRVIATSRSPYHAEAAALGVEYHTDADEFCEAHPDVVILASSIISTEAVIKSLPLDRLRKSTLFVDVLSVKAYPKHLLQALLPASADILCTHPMFGRNAGSGSWQGLNFMYEPVRVADTPASQSRLAAFLDFWASEGCRMVPMTCEEHDRQAASTQFITHTVGRMLGEMEVGSTDINTKGFESLLTLVQQTQGISFDLYYGLFLYNNSALDELERMERAFQAIKKQLLDQLHDIARAQLLQGAAVPRAAANTAAAAAAAAPAPAAPAAAPAAAASNAVPFARSHSNGASKLAFVPVSVSPGEAAVVKSLSSMATLASLECSEVNIAQLLGDVKELPAATQELMAARPLPSTAAISAATSGRRADVTCRAVGGVARSSAARLPAAAGRVAARAVRCAGASAAAAAGARRLCRC